MILKKLLPNYKASDQELTEAVEFFSTYRLQAQELKKITETIKRR